MKMRQAVLALGLAVAGSAFARAGSPCRMPQDRAWSVEAAVQPPQAVLRAREEAPVASAAPLLVEINGSAYWLGMVHRNPRRDETDGNPACYLAGSVAYYAIGTEHDPEVDFLELMRQGREAELRPRLIELRWLDAETGSRRRWLNKAMGRRLGWDTDALGRPAEWPVPAPEQPINQL